MSSHSFLTSLNVSERPPPQSSIPSPESQRVPNNHQLQFADDIAYAFANDSLLYPQRDPTLQNLSVDALWNRLTETNANRNIPTPNTNTSSSTNGTRVAASPISPLNHNQRPINSAGFRGSNAPHSVYSQSNNAVGSTYSEISLRDEPILQQPPTSALPVSPVPLTSLPQPAFEVQYPSASSARVSSSSSQSSNKTFASRSTLWWGDLEPWMDEQYAKQVCDLMGWPAVSVKIPHTQSDGSPRDQQANNPGYCFLTFPSPQHAATVLSHINNPQTGAPLTMPNSNKPFLMNWASSPSPTAGMSAPVNPQNGGAQKEYSIFVGDLAPETSNSDLVAVFRNPLLGLRNDRAPKFIRPFYSCKSAKIMLDPVTGVSRGYGFVRFTDESDQQRALIEMHGLYCLSRPMRISPATAKNKGVGGPSAPIGVEGGFLVNPGQSNVETTHAMAVSTLNGNSVTTSRSGSSIGSSGSIPSMTSSTTASSVSTSGATLESLAQLLASSSIGDQSQGGTSRPISSITVPLVQSQQHLEESWKHSAQARAILGNLIGPNGEQLTSTDPYNTTVFVGGLSPLISEETLRTFFAPFGDIHYVKVPTGKNCGFVQFVRKADAERAIERMQGFPIGGSRIRLSWGRSQYKAAQAAAQAAAAAQLQAAQAELVRSNASSSIPLTEDQAMEIIHKFGYNAFSNQISANTTSQQQQEALLDKARAGTANAIGNSNGMAMSDYGLLAANSYVNVRPTANDNIAARSVSNFSPFSPDPNYLVELATDRKDFGNLVQRFAGPSLIQQSGSGDRMSPSNSGSGGSRRSSTPSQGTIANEAPVFPISSAGSATAFPLNRAPGRPSTLGDAPSSRSVSGQSTTTGHVQTERERDGLRDVNGTLASLDLDAHSRSPGEMTDSSSGSVQFRLSMSGPGSPSS